ncbi:unnamed protein product [Pneumocystis jirovecii]|uniref:Uncharacterized protein n=1 Tax=Pneumocystis jirovecii TaxID=42068 RepID=L0P9W4_PNEJI|nr:unnamed protein product [Pneumocystis jirovecii]
MHRKKYPSPFPLDPRLVPVQISELILLPELPKFIHPPGPSDLPWSEYTKYTPSCSFCCSIAPVHIEFLLPSPLFPVGLSKLGELPELSGELPVIVRYIPEYSFSSVFTVFFATSRVLLLTVHFFCSCIFLDLVKTAVDPDPCIEPVLTPPGAFDTATNAPDALAMLFEPADLVETGAGASKPADRVVDILDPVNNAPDGPDRPVDAAAAVLHSFSACILPVLRPAPRLRPSSPEDPVCRPAASPPDVCVVYARCMRVVCVS